MSLTGITANQTQDYPGQLSSGIENASNKTNLDDSTASLNISQENQLGPIARRIQEARRQENIFKKGKNKAKKNLEGKSLEKNALPESQLGKSDQG